MFAHQNYSGPWETFWPFLAPNLSQPLCVLTYHVHMRGAPATCWGPAYGLFMDSLPVPSLLCRVIGGLLYAVQMFSCAWLFFKWPLSQGMAGQHGETSALTIFLSKQQMALLLSFWSGAKIPMAEVLVYTDAAWQGAASPNSSSAYRCLLCNLHF